MGKSVNETQKVGNGRSVATDSGDTYVNTFPSNPSPSSNFERRSSHSRGLDSFSVTSRVRSVGRSGRAQRPYRGVCVRGSTSDPIRFPVPGALFVPEIAL